MKVKFSENADYSSIENLVFEYNNADNGKSVFLNDDANIDDLSKPYCLGCFLIYYDAEMQGREYIAVNNEVIYLDNLKRL